MVAGHHAVRRLDRDRRPRHDPRPAAPARRRMVFKHALFPHMTAPRTSRSPSRCGVFPERRFAGASTKGSRSLSWRPFGDRYPRQLSGGQQQHRPRPGDRLRTKLLLMDEPLGALDRAPRGAQARDHAGQPPARGDGHLRHPRQGLVMSDPDRDLQPGPHRAARQRRGPVRPAGLAVRGRLHRRVQHPARPVRA